MIYTIIGLLVVAFVAVEIYFGIFGDSKDSKPIL